MNPNVRKFNVRYGVVNVVEREEYEKTMWKAFPYKFVSRNKGKAIVQCRKLNDSNFIVEQIYDTPTALNFKEEIFRGGKFKEKE